MPYGVKIMLGATAIAATLSTVAAQPLPVIPRDGPAAIVAGRQAGFLLSGATFASMKGAIDRGEDVKGQQFAARALARWARTVPSVFPKGTDVAPTAALPLVWSDRKGFEAKAADYAAAAIKLAQLANAGDKAGFAAQWAETRKTCSACHDTYRKPMEPRG